MRVTVTMLIAAVLLAAVRPAGAQPSTIAYQGELRSGGALFNGTADMKVAIVENGLSNWSNDGTSINGGEPTGSFSVNVVDGIFSVRLGDAGLGMFPISADLFFQAGYTPVLRVWVDTGGGFEQLPDQPLSASLFAINADAARYSVNDFLVGGTLITSPSGIMFDDGTTMTTAPGGGADSTWATNGVDVYRLGGNVGIGTAFPLSKFEVHGISNFFPGNGNIQVSTPGGWPGFIAYTPMGNRRDVIFDENGTRLLTSASGAAPAGNNGITVDNNGWLGVKRSPGVPFDVYGAARAHELTITDIAETAFASIARDGGVYGGEIRLARTAGLPDAGAALTGSDASGAGKLRLYGSLPDPTVELAGNNGGGGYASFRNTAGSVTATLAGQAFSNGSQMRFYRGTGQLGVEVTGGASELKCFDTNGVNTVWITGQDGGGDGRVRTDVLEITGGSDLSERFDISDGEAAVEPGMVVSIDRDHPGRLIVSTGPYEKTVAGIVSGAGGVKTGMVMGQEGTVADGEHPVALTGRVWAWCDAGGGPIEPGDLLTTSSTPGHAMKVTDHDRAHGAVIGKAMSALDEGRGLVLVLVGLQ